MCADARPLSSVERGHLRLITREADAEHATGIEGSSLYRAQSPEGQALVSTLLTSRSAPVFISGLPGTGKSTLLQHLVLDDVASCRGCVVVDPHGDLVEDILAACPATPDVRRRIVLFDPSDLERPPGLNLLDATSAVEQDKAIQFMIDLFQDLYLPDQQGPMLHQAIRNGMRLLMDCGGTLPELPRLFSDRDFLRRRLEGCRDPWVRHFFESVWMTVSGSSRGEYLAYYTSKLSHFVEDGTLRNILGQRRGLDLGYCLARGRVVLVSLSRGKIGDLGARLLGRILLHKLERATVERASLKPTARSHVNVYIDEFHEVASAGLRDFLGAGRKYGVGLALCTQRLGALPASTQEALLGTVGHYVVFRQGDPDGADVLASALWPRFRQRDLSLLPNYEAAVRVARPDGRPQLGRIRVPRPPVRDLRGARIIRAARRRALRREDVEADLRQRFLDPASPDVVADDEPRNG
jgi:hypothetical protein